MSMNATDVGANGIELGYTGDRKPWQVNCPMLAQLSLFDEPYRISRIDRKQANAYIPIYPAEQLRNKDNL